MKFEFDERFCDGSLKRLSHSIFGRFDTGCQLTSLNFRDFRRLLSSNYSGFSDRELWNLVNRSLHVTSNSASGDSVKLPLVMFSYIYLGDIPIRNFVCTVSEPIDDIYIASKYGSDKVDELRGKVKLVTSLIGFDIMSCADIVMNKEYLDINNFDNNLYDKYIAGVVNGDIKDIAKFSNEVLPEDISSPIKQEDSVDKLKSMLEQFKKF